MKKINTIIKYLTIALMFTPLSYAQKETILVGGIETNNISINKSALRNAIGGALNNTDKFIVFDKYDAQELLDTNALKNCLGKNCLVNVGKKVGANKVIAITLDAFADRIIINTKLIEVKQAKISNNATSQFENQPQEINRMIDMAINDLLEIPNNEISEKELLFKNSPALSNKLGIVNNSGMRIGFSAVTGKNGDYFLREVKYAERGTQPILLNIGYQFEVQYIGSEKFSKLFEFIPNIAGLEQGVFIPSLSILHGIRFGKGNWEIATGPSLSINQLSKGMEVNGVWQNTTDLNRKNILYNVDDLEQRPDARGVTYFNSN